MAWLRLQAHSRPEGHSYEELTGSLAPNKRLEFESGVPEEKEAEQGSLVLLSLDFPVRGRLWDFKAGGGAVTNKAEKDL